jgi:hypothetical protein
LMIKVSKPSSPFGIHPPNVRAELCPWPLTCKEVGEEVLSSCTHDVSMLVARLD